jgi:hypothetical protein
MHYKTRFEKRPPSRHHGLLPAERAVIAEGQGRRCAACERELADSGNVDHDHSHCPGAEGCMECIRGILCRPCNVALGWVKDDPEHLRALAGYVDRWNAKKPPALAGGNS